MAGICTLGTVLAAVLWIDPYDRGVFGGPVKGVADFGSRFSDASRARDPAFGGAILGNSHIQLVDPARLTAASGIRFVSLAISGTGPREQMVVLDAFLRDHRGTAQALVIGIDAQWCSDDAALPLAHPFPFWLYAPGPTAVLDGLLRYSTLEHAGRTIPVRLGSAAPARADGYWNYATEWLRHGHDAAGPLDASGDPMPPNSSHLFPAVDQLARRLAALPTAVAVTVVRPPVYVPPTAEPDGAQAATEAGCRSAIRRLADAHAGTRVVVLRADLPESRDPPAWFDQSHYKEPLARLIEAAIVGALKPQPAGSGSDRPSP